MFSDTLYFKNIIIQLEIKTIINIHPMFLRFVGTLLLFFFLKNKCGGSLYHKVCLRKHVFLNFNFIFIKNYFFIFLDYLEMLILKIKFKK